MRKSIAMPVLGVILAGCAASPGSATDTPSSGTAIPSPSDSSGEPTATATVEATPSGPAGMFAPDEIAAVVTTDLVVRSAPGTGADSEIYGGYLEAPRSVFVVDGPVAADGYEWYLVDPVRGQGIDEAPQPGWVAAAGKDGEPWLGPDPYTCPAPAVADLINLERQRALACYGDATLTVDGTLAGCHPSIRYGSEPWETECAVVRLGFDVDATPPPCVDCFEPTLWILFNGDIGLADEAAGTAIRVQGHFDDLAAQTCTQNDGFHGILKLRVHVCRMAFVATRATVTGS